MVMNDDIKDGEEMDHWTQAAVSLTNSAFVLLNYNRSMSFHCEVYEVLRDIFVKNDHWFPLEDWFTAEEGLWHLF